MKFWQLIREYVKPRDGRTLIDYAAESIKLFPPITREGYFHTEGSRHFIPILNALDDGRVREVNILKPVRGGGSLIGDVHLASVMPSERSPGPYMNVFQTDQDAKMHFFDRIERIMAGNESTRVLLPSKYEWSEIRLNNGHTLYTGGPGISNLQSKGVRYLRLDECWIYPAGRMAEAEARVGDYLKEEMSKILRISQAGPRDGLDIDRCEWNRAYNRAAIYEWEVECQSCHKFYSPVFSGTNPDGAFWGITWDHHRLANGDWDIPKCIPTIRFECPHCFARVADCPKTKNDWNRTGRYRLTNEDNQKRKSFHWETVIDFPWDELVELWLDACNAEARGNLQPKIQFYQKRRAIFKDEQSLLRGGLNFRRAEYEIASDWPDEKARFATFDRQQEDMYWGTVRAWSDTKSRRLWFGKVYGESAIKDIVGSWKVPPNRVGIDSAFEPKGDTGVYAMCIRNNWIALRGDDAYSFPHRLKSGHRVLRSYAPLAFGDPDIGQKGQGRRYAPLIRFSKPQMNSLVQRLIDSGAWEEPPNDGSEMEQEYAAQMGSRIKVTDYNKRTGESRVFWKEGKNDHARDVANGQATFAVLANLAADPAAEQLTKSEQKEVENVDTNRPG